jgi:hypothetical protein
MVILVTSLCLATGPAWADGPSAKCRAVVAGGRALVDVELSKFVDVRLARLVKLGLAGHIRLEVTLLRARPFWFDEAQDQAKTEAVLTWDRASREFLLDRAREVEDPVTLTLERVSLRPPDGIEEDGRYRIEVKAALRVVTPQSLGKVAAWLAGKGRDEDETNDLSRVLLDALAEDLARSASCTCEAIPAR